MLPIYTTPPTTARELGERVLAIVEQGWNKHNLARNAANEACDATSPLAVSCCLYGAMRRALNRANNESYDPTTPQEMTIIRPLWKALTWAAKNTLFAYNDDPNTKAADVIAVVREALTHLPR